MSDQKRDPWVDVKTFSDYPADQVISALQKEIRRGNSENAVLLEAVLATAVREGADILWLIVLHRNSQAKAFYNKYGFQSVG